MQVRAVQDRGCLGSAKFFYEFSGPVERALIGAFSDCDVVWREFSKIVPRAKDLVSIGKPGEFNAAIVIGAHRVVVHFDAPADDPPREALDAFARRLHSVGYATAADVEDVGPRCGHCPAGLLKGCRRTSAIEPHDLSPP